MASDRKVRICSTKGRSYMLVHLVLHQRLPLPAGAPSFTPQSSFACWSATAQPPSFFGTPTFLPHVARVSVLSTHPILTRPPPCSPYGVMAFVVSTPPASLGPHPPANLACLVPLTTAYTPTRLAFCGVSVTSHTPSLGVRPRLSPRAAHDDWNPGQLGFQFLYVQ